MRPSNTITCLAVALLCAAGSSTQAQIYEPFDYTIGNTGPWTGGSGFAAGESWLYRTPDFDLSPTMFATNIVPGLGYTNGRPVVVQGNAYRPAGFQSITRQTPPISGDPSLGGDGQTVWMSYLFQSNIGATDANLVSLSRGGGFNVDNAPKISLLAQREAVTFSRNYARGQVWDQFGERGFDSPLFAEPNTNVNLLVLQYVPDNTPPGTNEGTVRAWLNPPLDGTEPAPSTAFGQVLNVTEGLRAFDTLRLFSFSGNTADQQPTFDEVRVGNTFAQAVRQARPGDANADGSVNFDDLLVLAANYNGVANNGWRSGDFDLNGLIEFGDLLALAGNYNTTGATLEADWSLAQSIIPEPTTFALLAAAPVAMLRRRRGC
jgi:hypothetical protein